MRSPIDAFVLKGLEARGLRPAPAADRYTLLRRVTYDLTGLPPTQAEVDAFVADDAPDAYEKVVDRLLASPQYGVKWAQHWLDVVRYAETDGYERDSKKPFVWRYRDWVVDALNADMPYRDFVTKQLAGDELPDATVADHVATGFYRLGIWDDEPTDRPQHRYDVLDGIADTTARATLAISMGCARCHDHKKDPLPQTDYHSFLGHFENIAPYNKQSRTIPADGAKEAFEAASAQFAADSRRCRDELMRVARARLAAKPRATAGAVPGVVARYDGDVASTKELLDASGERNGKVEGQVVQVPGRKGQALRFDGDDFCRIPRVVENSFSVSFFVRSDQPGRGNARDKRWFTGTGLVDGEIPGIVDDWGVSWIADGVIAAGTGRPEKFVSSPAGYNDGEWHHVAFTRDQQSGKLALFVDGQLAGENTGSKRPLTTPDDLVIGRSRPGGGGFRGDLDELTFYDRALSPAEVAALALDLPGGVAAAAAIEGTDALKQLSGLRAPEFETVEILAVREHGSRAPEPVVRLRGNVHARGPQVPLGVPAMLGAAKLFAPAPTKQSSGRRLSLAKWITAEDNRMTWRVIANRVWQHHFGRGIVRSSNDFGRLGDRPTHPELLDWLACEVLARGQSLKAMHRLIVRSSTYRMSSQADPKGLAEDPLNDAMWRFDRRRLTAEEIRDSILAANGTLNLERGGPSVYPKLPQAVLDTASRPGAAWGRSSPEQAARRSIYVHVKRSLPEPLMAAFDRADTDASCPVRFVTVQPTQALSMVNGDFANMQAELFAQRLRREARDMRSRMRRGLELISQRPARDADVARLMQLAAELQSDFGRSEEQALQRCCLVLLNCNEFVFLD
ncbi:MAG: DUF1553 domain-containing protein [Planctomycetota bacterium]|nr:DUF1553 domain-containing protein [Planctomycetota bacterium]